MSQGVLARLVPVILSGVQPSQVEGYTLLDLDIKEAHTYFVEIEEGAGYVLLNEVPKTAALAALAKLRSAP